MQIPVRKLLLSSPESRCLNSLTGGGRGGGLVDKVKSQLKVPSINDHIP